MPGLRGPVLEGKGGLETMGGDQREPVHPDGARVQLRGPVRWPQGGWPGSRGDGSAGWALNWPRPAPGRPPQGTGGCAEEPPC